MIQNYPLSCRNFKNGEKFRPMTACADCAGSHGSILFANVGLLDPFCTAEYNNNNNKIYHKRVRPHHSAYLG